MGVGEPRHAGDNRWGVGRLRPERLEEKAIWRPLEGREDKEALTVNTVKGHGCGGTQVGGSQ